MLASALLGGSVLAGAVMAGAPATGPRRDETPAQQACTAASSAPALDHVILVVTDLDRAGLGFVRQGFRLKQGRLHANNLLNRHVKFRDGTSIELMTVMGRPGDAMARDYANLLRAGEGGVYVGLDFADLDAARQAAGRLGLETQSGASGSWRFLSFPSGSPAAAIFFGAGGTPARDPDSLVTHRVDVAGLDEAWIEGGPELGELLSALGAKSCGSVRSPKGIEGERWALSRGSIVVVPAGGTARPRVLGAVLRRAAPGEGVMQPHPAFWLQHRHR